MAFVLGFTLGKDSVKGLVLRIRLFTGKESAINKVKFNLHQTTPRVHRCLIQRATQQMPQAVGEVGGWMNYLSNLPIPIIHPLPPGWEISSKLDAGI